MHRDISGGWGLSGLTLSWDSLWRWTLRCVALQWMWTRAWSDGAHFRSSAPCPAILYPTIPCPTMPCPTISYPTHAQSMPMPIPTCHPMPILHLIFLFPYLYILITETFLSRQKGSYFKVSRQKYCILMFPDKKYRILTLSDAGVWRPNTWLNFI